MRENSNSNNIKLKILVMFLFTVTTIIVSLLYYNYQNKKLIEQKQIQSYKQDSSKMYKFILQNLNDKYIAYIKNSFITEDIIEALEDKNRQKLVDIVYPKYILLNNIFNTTHKIHFYDNQNRPIIELSKNSKKINSDFKSHEIIHSTNSQVAQKSGIEIERDEINYQIVVPIVNKFKHLGSIEISIAPKYIVKILEKHLNVSSLVIIKNSKLTKLQDKSKILGNFNDYSIIYQNRLCPEIKDDLNLNENISLIEKNNKKYIINTDLNLKDFNNQNVGKIIIAYDITEFLDHNSMLFINTILIISLVVIVLFIIFNFLLDILIKDIKNHQDTLINQKQLLHSIINSVDDIIFYKNREFKYELVNKSFEKLLNKSKDEILGKSDDEILDKESATVFKMVDEETLYNSSYNTNYNILTLSNGKNIHLLSSKYPLKDNQNNVIGIVGSAKDITSYKLIEQNLIKAQDDLKEHHKTLELKVFEQNREIQNSKEKLISTNKELSKQLKVIDDNVIMVSTDTSGKIIDVSKAYLKLTGYSKSELLKYNFSALRDKDFSSSIYKDMWHTIKNGDIWTGEIKNRDINNNSFWLDIKIFPIFDDDGEIVRFKAISNNITDKKLIQELAITDELTKLYNRRYFNQKLDNLINEAIKNDLYFSFMMFDIDHFKLYNDNYGHQAGDVALEKVANALKNSTKIDDLFRLGGEEFGLLALSLSPKEADKIAYSIKEAIKNLNIEHTLNVPHNVVTVSMGLLHIKGSQITSSNDIYKTCDELLYKAKRTGRNTICSNIKC
jgi:diguanylate cyclase (GGDEF)-like protein/PAS domain S-box-containing protein